MPNLKPLARLADNLLDEGLEHFIAQRRADGKSWDTVAKELWAATNHEIDVTGVTVQKWNDDIARERAAS